MPSHFTHWCPFANDEPIDERSSEFVRCKCFRPTYEILRLQDFQAVQLDAERDSII